MSTVTKAKTAFAEETGRIAAMVERNLMTGAPSYPLKRIPETKYDTSLGHSPRTVRVQTVPPARTDYQPMIATGNEAKNWVNPLTGETIAGYGDKQGPGELAGEKIKFGYEEFGRCLRGTALETDPIDVLDILEKKAFGATIERLRKDMPRYAKEKFADELLNQVVLNSKFKFSVAGGFPRSTNVATFPCIPTGGPDIGTFRLIENLLRHEGWDEGSETPVIGGRPALQLYMGRDSIEFAIVQRKKQREMKLETMLTVDDKTFGKTEINEGIQFIENPLPPRGYIVQTGANAYKFIRIPEWIVSAGVEGVIKNVNPDYYKSFVIVGGQSFVVMELGFCIHPKAMERQAMGAIPTVAGKKFDKMFNFEVNLVPDWEIGERGQNKDGRLIAFRMTHAYAPLPYNPELMTAFAYIAPTPQQFIVNPNGDPVTAANEPLTIDNGFRDPQPLVAPVHASEPTRDPTSPSCTDLFPANGVGVIRFAQISYYVDESAGTLTVVVERAGGSSGAATVDYDTVAGTATAGVEYTTTTGTLSWADGVFGIKSFTVPILETAGDDSGKQFTIELSGVTGATLGAQDTATVTILDSDEA